MAAALKNTLFARLGLALLVIVGLIGGGFFALEQVTTRHYYEEITQRLNASIAMYVTGEMQLIENGDGVDTNHKTALEWYRKAANHKLTTAYRGIGRILRAGSAGEQDVAEAVDVVVEEGRDPAELND